MAFKFPGSWRIGLGLVLALVFANAGTAVAGTTLFVAPGGNNTSCQAQLPCSITQAVAKATAGDEILLQSGMYTDAGNPGDLGIDRFVQVKSGVTMRGVPGAPRPTIELTTPLQFGNAAFSVADGGAISHLEIETTVAPREIFVSGTAEDLIVRSSTPGGVSCTAVEGVLRDTACLSTGANGIAIGPVHAAGPITPQSVQLRNVTAIATGSNSVGIDIGFEGRLGGGSIGLNDRAINAIGVLARGTEHDIVLSSFSAAPTPGNGAIVNMTLANSDYRNVTTSVDVPGAGGSVTVTQPGTGTNITQEPLLAADNIHQLPSSPTVDAGATDALSGATALDGVPRKLGKAPDIGAEEFAGATVTAVSCDQPSLAVGAITHCVATVGDEFPSVAPGGQLNLKSSGAGTFDNGACKVEPLAELGKIGCRITYKPSQIGSGTHTITASYPGDAAHTASSGSTQVQVVPSKPAKAPQTILKTKPKRQTSSPRARFTFASDTAGASFQCKLDKKPFKPCRSPFTAKVKAGRHVFSVRAVSGKSVDPTPAVYRWTVRRR